MNCLEPYVSGDSAFPCGKCPSCVSLRRRIWSHRIMLEAAQWSHNAFCTLTYAESKVPVSLEPDHLTLFLKRLRSRWKMPLRYYAVGEYSPSMRPHFHLALFNYPHCQHFGLRIGDCPCEPCSVVRESWNFGHILLGSLETKSAAYIAGYVLKKMNSRSAKLSSGLRPEFARMSLRPHGIGAGALWDVASVMMQSRKAMSREDVPVSLRHGIRQMPLGPYLRRKLRERIGRDVAAPESAKAIAAERVRGVFEYAKVNAPASVRREVVKSILGEFNEQLNRNIAAKNVRKGTLG